MLKGEKTTIGEKAVNGPKSAEEAKTLEEYQEYVKKRLDELSPILQKLAVGDFSESINIPEKEDEFTELLIALDLMIDDLRVFEKEQAESQKTLEKKVEERTREFNENIKELEKSEAATLNIMEDLQKTLEELKQSKNKIEQQNVELKRLDQLKSAFLNTTSHELRTPIASIKGYVQMLLKQSLGDISDEQKNALNVVLRNTDRLDHLIQDTLDISRLESGTMKFIPEKTDVKELIKETAETMQSLADHKSIKINSEVEDKIPELIVDQERIRQVLINLVDNAIKFSPNGSSIIVRARKEKEDVLFEVQDFGRGIPKDEHKKVFEPFYQVDSGMDRKYGGAGLGLSISYGIVVSHGGKIWVDSNIDKGSTFRFTLPVKPVEDMESRFKEVDMFGLKNRELYYFTEIIPKKIKT